ncbi:uncharacterized protein LOC131613523 [Vicia villosa]|uniref:uncharacterized protein LOC131613523 n=1 Tax=Vicia villosa TaxID=3911 RepID=UPI00273B4999|nr:uncharacterized protein LOC131613523 [Vicia villosa]
MHLKIAYITVPKKERIHCIHWLAWDKLACPKRDGGLGFRDFWAFNLAMVAKQGWKLLSDPVSLVSRFFKARYFPNSSFLNANLGSNPSFMWRSLWKARDVLCLGCRWSIGTGSNIKVLHDSWLWGSTYFRVSGLFLEGVYNLTVQDLLLPNSKQWNVGVVNSLFEQVVADQILNTPLIEEVVDDVLIWNEERSGAYSVRIGREDKKDAGRFAMVVESLWKNQNNIVWNNNREDLARIGIQAYYNWFDWFNARDDLGVNIDPQLPMVRNPPAVGWLKCNVDAGFNNYHQTTNRAWWLRDNLGRFLVAGVAWDKGITSPIEAEALALKEAIQTAITMNLNNVIFESDSQVVIHAINSTVTGKSEFNIIITAIRRLLSLVTNFEVKFIKRQANMVVDSLVKAANSWSRRSFVNVAPPCIDIYLVNDMN